MEVVIAELYVHMTWCIICIMQTLPCAKNFRERRMCACLQYAGIIISPIAILFMVYALFMYKRRTIQILQRANVRYDDQRGPVLLVILLIVATLASLVLTAYGTLR